MTSCSSKKIRNRKCLTATRSLLSHLQESKNCKEKEKSEEREHREQIFNEEKEHKRKNFENYGTSASKEGNLERRNARIDRIYCSRSIKNFVNDIRLDSTYVTDHSTILTQCSLLAEKMLFSTSLCSVFSLRLVCHSLSS
jgi:hypothetical protein